MRRTCLAAALLMLPLAALAKWDDFVTTDEAVVYADRSNASRIGNVVRVTSVTDLKRPLTIEQGVVREGAPTDLAVYRHSPLRSPPGTTQSLLNEEREDR